MSGVMSLRSDQFDAQLNIVDPSCMQNNPNCLRNGNLIILVYRPGCPHCDIYHPTFVQASNSHQIPNLRFAEINTTDEPDFLNKVRAAQGTIEFKIDGVPTVLGYSSGRFYSVYGPSAPGQSQHSFRSLGDTIEYASGIGTAPIVYDE